MIIFSKNKTMYRKSIYRVILCIDCRVKKCIKNRKMRSKTLNSFFSEQLFFKRYASYLVQLTTDLNATFTEMFVIS